ncbi:alkylmercury lyase [Nocardia sp. NPDC055049]
MRLEILQVPDCPNAPVLENRIRRAVAGRPVEVEIVHHIVRDAEHAVSAGMTGSPTLLIDGRDPFATAGSVPSLACRLYPSSDGLDGAPAVSALRAALGLAEDGEPTNRDDTASCYIPESETCYATDTLSSQPADAHPADAAE